jgi:hypothetical protein
MSEVKGGSGITPPSLKISESDGSNGGWAYQSCTDYSHMWSYVPLQGLWVSNVPPPWPYMWRFTTDGNNNTVLGFCFANVPMDTPPATCSVVSASDNGSYLSFTISVPCPY